MFKTVVVGVDGHEGGRDAVALARKLTSPGGRLTLAHVYPHHPASSVIGYDDDEAADIVRARELLKAAREEAGSPAEMRWTGASSPGRGLHELAETLRADLLVVGSTRRGVLGRVLSGDDTRATLDGAPCAVAIAPAGYADHPAEIQTVGVGYDGSPDSERALVAARALASELGAGLTSSEVSTHTARLAGPAEELAQWSAALDLLVVGSRGWGSVGRLVHGSTSQELARWARCPLLVLTRPRPTATKPDEAAGDLALAGYPRD